MQMSFMESLLIHFYFLLCREPLRIMNYMPRCVHPHLHTLTSHTHFNVNEVYALGGNGWRMGTISRWYLIHITKEKMIYLHSSRYPRMLQITWRYFFFFFFFAQRDVWQCKQTQPWLIWTTLCSRSCYRSGVLLAHPYNRIPTLTVLSMQCCICWPESKVIKLLFVAFSQNGILPVFL